MPRHLPWVLAITLCAAAPGAAELGRADTAPAAVPGHGIAPAPLAQSTETEPDELPYCYCSHDDPMCDPEKLIA